MNKQLEIEKLQKNLRLALKDEQQLFARLEIGKPFWVPCQGVDTRNVYGRKTPDGVFVAPGHTGRITTPLENRQIKYGKWMSKEEAEDKYPNIKLLAIETMQTGALCPDCTKLLR